MRIYRPMPVFAAVTPDDDAGGGDAFGELRKKAGVRAWLVLDAAGRAQVVEAGKHAIMRRTGLPARDLRVLDPILSYPSAVLGRERAIVVNLEHIKAIITAQEVLLLNSWDPSVKPFVDELQRRILRHYHAINKSQEKESPGNADDADWADMYDLEGPHSREAGFPNTSRSFRNKGEYGKEDGKHGLDKQDGWKPLPFEFIALEACLEAACGSLDGEARILEKEAHPILDKLTTRISTLNLERVRQIKSRLLAVTGRVQKVRDELEHLLDDDGDMAEMYLTSKIMQQLENSPVFSIDEKDGASDEILQSEMDGRVATEILTEVDGAIGEGDVQQMDHQQDQSTHALRGAHTVHSAIRKQLDVEELENLLEAYFVQIDGTLNKLSTLREYVDDTEDYVNIMLDDKQNHLLQMGVMLVSATVIVSIFVVVAGILGMNIHIDLFNDTETGQWNFLWTIGGGTGGGIFLFVGVIAWWKYKQILK